jgi:anti-sigma-K factor RskA
MSCEQIREMIEAYALGALDAPDQAMVETHLAECAACRQLLNEYAEMVNALPQAVALASPLQPPDSLKARVLKSLETAPPLTPAASAPKKSQPTFPRPKSWWRIRPLAAAALTLLIVVLLGWSVQMSVALARERALRAEFANLVDKQEVVLEVIDSSKTTRRVLLPLEKGSSDAYGKLFTRSDLPHVVAMAARLPQPPPGQAYHLWVISAGQTHLAGVMKVNEQGFGLLVFDADRNGPVYDSAELTLQPIDSTTPADSPLLIWKLSAE